SRDWSSDVCSSDLERNAALDQRQAAGGAGFAYGGGAAAVRPRQRDPRQQERGAQQQGKVSLGHHRSLAMAATAGTHGAAVASVRRTPAQEPCARGSSKRAGSRRGASRCTTSSATT